MGYDICLEDLTDSDSSDVDESEKVRDRKRGSSLTIKRNNKGETQLHQACISGNLELAKRLIDQGHVVNIRDHAGWIPLHEACNHGFKAIVELLLAKGASAAINDRGGTSCDGITPLYDACCNGFLDVIELLLDQGADATVKTDFGDTCLSALDIWRNQVKLTDCEQAQYVCIRDILQTRLTKGGITSQSSTPLTNASCQVSSPDEKYWSSPNKQNQLSHNNDSMSQPVKSTLLPSSKNANDSKNCDKARATKAKQEYRYVMESLKRPHRSSNIDDDSCAYLVSRKPTALLSCEEIDVDNWLDDDLAPETKKRKFVVENSLSRSCSKNYASKESLLDSAISGVLNEPNAFQMIAEASSNSINESNLSRSSSMNSNAAGKRKKKAAMSHQASLFDSGFCRFLRENSISSEDSTDGNALCLTEPDSTTATHQYMIASPVKCTPPILPPTVSFKIKVEDELLLVPIERKTLNETKILWLAEEASRRYYK